jgi:ABC-type proline/glycine betaine transport system permease subunit
MNNSSFFTADRATHLKIVVVSLLASIVVLAIGIAARPSADNAQMVVYKPTPAVLATSDAHESVR